MALVGCWYQYVHGWATNSSADWSHDVEIAPSAVLCTGGLSSYGNSQYSGADTGIVQYTTRDPNSGVDSVHDLGGQSSPVLQGLAPAFFDYNVDSVTFWFHVEDADEGVVAMALFQLLTWG